MLIEVSAMQKFFLGFLFFLMTLHAHSLPLNNEAGGLNMHPTSASMCVAAGLLPAPAANLPSPSLRCLAVQANGDVQLSWVLPDTTGSSASVFNCYGIWYSSSPGGPYTKIDSIYTFGTTTYTHTGAGANGAPCYYYIRTRSLGGATFAPALDSLHTIFLILTNPGNGTAVLNWNPIRTPLPATSTGWYKIWRQHGAFPWVLVDSTRGFTYTDTIAICQAFINYRIEIADSSGCKSVSNVAGANFKDIIAPKVVVMDSASVSAGGKAELAWYPDPSKDTKGYVIFELIGGTWKAIDTIYGASVSSYTYPNSNAGGGSETYGICAFDSCGNLSTLSPTQHTLFLQEKKDVCTASLKLTWNNFINLPHGVGNYTLMLSVNAGPYAVQAMLAAGDTTYTMTGMTALSNYCFYVIVANTPANIDARSNIICYTASTPNEPKFNYLNLATVTGPNSVKLSAHVDITAMVKQYNFYRALSATSIPVLIATVAAPAGTNISVTDNAVNTNLQSYYYSMYVVDSCGNEQSKSNVDETIHLSVVANDAITTNTLSWNDYSSWLGNVQSYDIYRAVDGVWQAGPVANVPFAGTGQNSYADNVAAYYASSGRFEYYVQALEGPGDTYGFRDTSTSNIAKALQNADLFIPNAFVPMGVNKIFRPEGSFVELEDYHFAIFDRWGEKVFETSDKLAGWDGTWHGQRSELGVYVYLISYKTAHGEFVDRKGTVTLLR
ncbi:MAG: gliding motility-associated C-terminal domain-containing protein [Bacteroidia bacterium]